MNTSTRICAWADTTTQPNETEQHEENVENQNKVSAYFYAAGGENDYRWMVEMWEIWRKDVGFFYDYRLFLFSAASECDSRTKTKNSLKSFSHLKRIVRGMIKWFVSSVNIVHDSEAMTNLEFFPIFIFFA